VLSFSDALAPPRRKGMDLYFKRHDGQAVTCDDFRAAMADANGRDFSAFTAWRAGLPAHSAVPVASVPVPKSASAAVPLSNMGACVKHCASCKHRCCRTQQERFK